MKTLSEEYMFTQADPELIRKRKEARRNISPETRASLTARFLGGMTQDEHDKIVQMTLEHLRREEEKKARRHLTEPQS
jgi:hypothetical protein